MKYSALLISLFLLQFNNLVSQDDEIYCLDIKTGFFYTQTYSDDFISKENRFGSKGRVDYPYVSIPQSNIRNHSQTHFGPYFSANLGIRYNRFFELAVGYSFMQVNTGFTYYTLSSVYDASHKDYYYRTITIADGKLIHNISRVEFAPVFRLFNTKLIFGLLNFEIYNRKIKNLSGARTEYQVLVKKGAWNYPETYPQDSVVTELSSTDVSPSYNLKNRYFFPLSIGVEQEIPVKKLRYLVGLKISYAHRSYAPLFFYGYLGVRFSKEYTWKE